MISIGYLAKTYRMLPSEVISKATTYDIMIADVWTTWQNSKLDKNNTENYKTEDLEKLMKEVRG